MSTDSNDLTPITPAHFLIDRTFTSVADLTLYTFLRFEIVQAIGPETTITLLAALEQRIYFRVTATH